MGNSMKDDIKLEYPELKFSDLKVRTDYYAKDLTKREYFAGLAMQGQIAHGWVEPEEISEKAVMLADALLAELEKFDED